MNQTKQKVASVLAPALAPILEIAINRAIQLDGSLFPEFEKMSGNTLAIELGNTAVLICISLGAWGVAVTLGNETSLAQALVKTTVSELVSALKNKDHMEQLTISGDEKFALQLLCLLSEIDIDIEEILSAYVGDVVAHKTGTLFRAVGDWGKHAKESLQMDIAEYLSEEIHFVPAKCQVEDFNKGVEKLEQQVKELEQRIHKMHFKT